MSFIFGILGGLIGAFILLLINSELDSDDDETFTKPKLRNYDEEQRPLKAVRNDSRKDQKES